MTRETAARVFVGTLLVVVGHAFAASAQETPPKSSILLKQFTAPDPAPPAGSITRDDLRELPAPKVDTLSDVVQFRAGVVDDPLCLPGEEGYLPPPRARRPSRRH